MLKYGLLAAIAFICLLFLLSGDIHPGTRTEQADQPDLSFEEWGSFTPEKTYSYDQKYYALQTVVEDSVVHEIIVCIYRTEDDELVFSFSPARARDFWGICWESDTYNIWTQSADIGVDCYRYENMRWVLDRTAQRPDDIISKYDK